MFVRLGNRLLLAFLFFVSLLAFFQFSVPELIGQDSWLHAGMAGIISQEGFSDSFPYTSESIFVEHYADLQWGYRLLLIPFLFFGSITGVKIASVLFGALFFVVLYWYLLQRKIPYAFFWTCVSAVVSGELLYRFMLARALPLALSLLIVTIYALEESKNRLLFIVSLLSAWLYQGFVIQSFVVVLFFLMYRRNVRLLGYGLLGTLVGVVVSPYFPKNISLLWTQIVQVNLLSNAYNLEWKAWPIGELLSVNGFALLLFVVAMYVVFKRNSLNKQSLFFLAGSVFFLAFMLRTRRMHEFFVPFAVLFSVFTLSKIPVKKSFRCGAVGVLIVLGLFQGVSLHDEISRNHFLPWYSDGVEWMSRHIEPGARVFNNGYAFSYLFFNNPQFKYTHGVDLTYAELYDEVRFRRYIGVLQGQNPGFNIITEDYAVDYVIVGKIKQDVALFRYVVAYQEDFELVYEDESAAVLKVVV